MLNYMAAKDSHIYTPEEILAHRYEPEPESVTVTHDPDEGAAGNWQGLRDHLKGESDV